MGKKHRGESFVFFGPTDWWSMNPSSGTHIAKNLALFNKVLYINPISTDLGGTIQSGGISANLFKKIFRKLKSFLKLIKKENDNLYIFSPFFLPVQGNAFLDFVNNILIKIQLNIACLILRMGKSILWIENIRAADFIKKSKWKLVVHQASDLFIEDDFNKNKKKLIERDERVVKNSDLLICVSRELYNIKKEIHKNVIYLPHGVDFEKFEAAVQASKRHGSLENIKEKVIGYYGTLTDSNDIELLEYCAKELSHCFFIFAGRITGGDYSGLKSLPNVKFTGMLPYEEIPDLCASIDVALLPWKMCKWIECCNPLKLFEYMAAGKPVVSVAINEIMNNYSELVSVAHGKEEFAKAIEYELEKDSELRKKQRVAIARKNSWKEHIKIIMGHVEDLLESKNNKQVKRG